MATVGSPRVGMGPASSTPRTAASRPATAPASRALSRRSGPTTLTLFSPLMPDTASSTLSRIICEKLKTTPGNSRRSSASSCSVSFSLVNPMGQLSNGLSGAKISMLLKPLTSVPSSGRPSWETVVSTSG
jgi:hypothetical protein